MATREEMAVITGVGFGIRDTNRCILWFGVKMLHGGSLQVLSAEEAIALIEGSEIRDIKDLEGKPCVCEIEGNSVIFKRLL